MQTPPTLPLRVLLVEDDQVNLKIMSRIFGRLVLEHRTAGDGIEALHILDSWKPDVIVTDLSMPHLDGIGLITELVHRGNPPKIVVISAHNESTILGQVQGILPCQYLAKPLHVEQVEETLVRIAKDLANLA